MSNKLLPYHTIPYHSFLSIPHLHSFLPFYSFISLFLIILLYSFLSLRTFPFSSHSLPLPSFHLPSSLSSLRSPPFAPLPSLLSLFLSLSLLLTLPLALSPSLSPYVTLSFPLLQFTSSLLLYFFSLSPPIYPSPSLLFPLPDLLLSHRCVVFYT